MTLIFMPRIYKSCVIEAPLQRVWDYIRDFNCLPKWFPGVTDSKIEYGMRSDQVGCIRDFGLDGGQRIREQLLALSDQVYSWAYKMLAGPLPLSNYIAIVRLLPVTDGNRTFTEYLVEFDCSPEKEAELKTFLGNTYEGAFEHLKQHLPQP